MAKVWAPVSARKQPEIFCLSFIIRVHGQEFNSYQRRSRGKRLRDLQLRRQEKFLYLGNTLDLWEWEIRVLDIQDGVPEERFPRSSMVMKS